MPLVAGHSGAFRPIVPLSAASSRGYFILSTLAALVGARSGVDSPTAPPSADEAARFGAERCGVVGGVERWAPLHARLARGLPINALAIGSSLVGVHGGCTNPAPIFNSSACLRKCPRCCGSRCGEWGNRGWARELLEWLVRTYPVDPRVNGQQRRHELYNLGEPGGNLIPTIVACPQTYVGFEVHLVLLDLWTAGLHKHAEGTEKLIRHLLASPGQPTLMIVEFGVPSFIDHLAAHRLRAQAGPSGLQVGAGSGAPFAPRLKPAARGGESASERGGGASPSAALRLAPNATLSQWRDIVARAWSASAARGSRAGVAGAVERMIASIPRPDPIRSASRGGDLRAQMVQARRVVQAMYGLRAHYGLPLFSVPACLGPILGDGSVGMGYRGYASDGLHPTRQGALLLSRALIAHVQRGLRMAAAVAPTADSAAVAAARLAAGTPPRPLRLPPPPPLPQAMHRIPARVGLLCFTLDRDGASFAQRAQRIRKGERRARSVADNGGGVLPTISAQSRGWEFVEYEEKSATRYKPGLVATQPGAFLEISMELQGARQPSLLLQFLRSYAGHGIARVSCAGGCSCGPLVVDSHNGQENTSVLDELRVPLAAPAAAAGSTRPAGALALDGSNPGCLLRLRVLNETRSGGHKFKLVRIIVEEAAPTRRARMLLARTGSWWSGDVPAR